jgi:uncharacterized RDD family membrane protein YckC
MSLAPVWRRAAALVTDGCLLLAMSGLYVITTGGAAAASLLAVALVMGGVSPELDGAFKFGIAVTALSLAGGLLVVHLLYWVLFTGLGGQTPGKMLFHIRVVGPHGEHPGLARAFMREVVGKFLSKLVCYLGYLWALADGRRQTWHDKIAGTYVVLDQTGANKRTGAGLDG